MKLAGCLITIKSLPRNATVRSCVGRCHWSLLPHGLDRNPTKRYIVRLRTYRMTHLCFQPYGYTDLEQFYSGKESPLPSSSTPSGKAKGKKPPSAEVLLAKRKKIWHHIVKKDIPKASKARVNLKKEQVSNAKKVNTNNDCSDGLFIDQLLRLLYFSINSISSQCSLVPYLICIRC